MCGLLLGAACTNSGPGSANGDGRLTVLTSVYPFQFVAERVGGASITVTNLTEPGAEPHDLELSPRQVGSMTQAGMIIYEKGFQPAVDEAVAQSENPHVFDTTTVVPLEPVAATGHEGESETGEESGHGDEHGHDHAGDHTGELDPHVWLDPTRLSTIATAVANRLAEIDPSHADEYRANLERLRGELSNLDRDFRSGLTGCQRTEFITAHTAFGYLAKRYGLTQIGISGLSPDTEPSPARVAAIQREALEHQVTTIFTETLVSPAVAQAIAGDLGLRTDILDPIEGITAESKGGDYLAIMRTNLTALEGANGCPRI